VTATVLGALVALALCIPPAAPLDVEGYRTRLLSIETLLLHKQRDAAADEARALLSQTVDWGTARLPTDSYVLLRIANPKQEGVVAPLRALLSAFSTAPPSSAGVPPLDRAALAALAREEADRAASGALAGPSLGKLPFSEVLAGAAKRVLQWMKERLRDFWRWLRKWLFPRAQVTSDKPASRLVTVVLVGAGIVLLAALLAALLSVRRRGVPLTPLVLAPAPDVDANPLSRTGSEWVQRAQALAAAGRHREAIRAWYHALLVSCYRAGLLHHQMGFTNWEYVRSLGADVPWRARFSELTGRFDLEWYGRAESSPEALDAFSHEAFAILGELEGAKA
jgi:hypothetical protein